MDSTSSSSLPSLSPLVVFGSSFRSSRFVFVVSRGTLVSDIKWTLPAIVRLRVDQMRVIVELIGNSSLPNLYCAVWTICHTAGSAWPPSTFCWGLGRLRWVRITGVCRGISRLCDDGLLKGAGSGRACGRHDEKCSSFLYDGFAEAELFAIVGRKWGASEERCWWWVCDCYMLIFPKWNIWMGSLYL